MEGMAFHYDRHEKLQNISDEGYALSCNGNVHVLLTFKFFGWFCYSRHHTVQFNI